MTPAEAAWVRKHAWNGIIRAEHRRAPGEFLLCGCEYGPSRWCQDGQHGGCHRECPHPSVEAWVWTRRGHVARFAEPYQHPYPYKAGRRPQQPDAWARLWLTDRVCRWVCACPCHAPEPARPVTYEAVALPGLELIGATHARLARGGRPLPRLRRRSAAHRSGARRRRPDARPRLQGEAMTRTPRTDPEHHRTETRMTDNHAFPEPLGPLYETPTPDPCPGCNCCTRRLCEAGKLHVMGCLGRTHTTDPAARNAIAECPCDRAPDSARTVLAARLEGVTDPDERRRIVAELADNYVWADQLGSTKR